MRISCSSVGRHCPGWVLAAADIKDTKGGGAVVKMIDLRCKGFDEWRGPERVSQLITASGKVRVWQA